LTGWDNLEVKFYGSLGTGFPQAQLSHSFRLAQPENLTLKRLLLNAELFTDVLSQMHKL